MMSNSDKTAAIGAATLIPLAETIVCRPYSLVLLCFFFPSSSEPLALDSDWLTNRLIGLGAGSGIGMDESPKK